MKMLKRIGLVALLSTFLSCPAISWAQADQTAPSDQTGGNPVEARGVGISGGAIAGAELVIAVEAAFGIDKLWAYLTFPVLGAVGGGVGGYYLEKNAHPGASVGLLAGSLALIIPTAIFATSAMAYDPDDEGALSDQQEDGSSFSFEMDPSINSDGDQATTEIEERPEDGPENPLAPPPQSGPPAPETDEPDGEESPSTEGDNSPAPDTSSKPRDNRANEQRMARIRRATAGALLFVDADGSPALTVPLVGIRPTVISLQGSELITKQGVEIMVPLLRIDLP